MKGLINTVLLAVLVTGMVFISGCISTGDTGTATAEPGPSQTIDETVPATQIPETALTALTSPPPARTTISAVTTPSMIASAATPPVRKSAAAVPAVNDTGDNTSAPRYDEPPAAVSIEGVTGSLLIHVAAGSGDTLAAYIARNGSNVPPVDPSFDHYRSVGERLNPAYLHVKIMPDGNSGIVNLMPGRYLAYLPDRRGGEPELQSFTITPRYLTYVTFTGKAVGSPGGCGC